MNSQSVFVVPAGWHTTVHIAATPGNVATSIIPSAEIRYQLLGFKITLVADATVANRYIRFGKRQVTTGYNPAGTVDGGAVAASQTKTLAAGPWGFVVTGGFTRVDTAYAGLSGLWLVTYELQGYIDIEGGVAGDSYSGDIELLEYPG